MNSVRPRSTYGVKPGAANTVARIVITSRISYLLTPHHRHFDHRRSRSIQKTDLCKKQTSGETTFVTHAILSFRLHTARRVNRFRSSSTQFDSDNYCHSHSALLARSTTLRGPPTDDGDKAFFSAIRFFLDFKIVSIYGRSKGGAYRSYV